MFLKKLLFLYIVLFSFSFNLWPQDQKDILEEKTFQELRELYEAAKENGAIDQAAIYGKAMIQKGKNVGDTLNLIRGYRMMSILYEDERILIYSDSITMLENEFSNESYPAVAYEKKGDFYSDKEAFQRALDNYLKFNEYARKFNNAELIFRSNYRIASLKRRTGNLDEALELFRKSFAYGQKYMSSYTEDDSYLNSIHAMASIFNDKVVVDSANYYNAFGLKEAARLQDEYYSNLFAMNQGITLFHEKEYISAIDTLKRYVRFFEGKEDLLQIPLAYFYTGESYWLLNQRDTSMKYYQKVDSVFEKTKSLFPNIKEAYDRLVKHYEKTGDLKNLSKYNAQYRKVDSVVNADKVYMSENMYRNYNIPKLKESHEKERKENEAKEEDYQNVIVILAGFILLLSLGFFIQFKKRQLYKQRFDAIVQDKEQQEPISKVDQKDSETTIHVPTEVIHSVLEALETFEKEYEFTSNEVTLGFLAKKFKTNPNYLSKIINHFKGNSFSTYVNNLRINYCIEQLKANSSYQKYTIKAISHEMGFNNVQSFTKAFYKSKGINPSYFLKELRKMES